MTRYLLEGPLDEDGNPIKKLDTLGLLIMGTGCITVVYECLEEHGLCPDEVAKLKDVEQVLAGVIDVLNE